MDSFLEKEPRRRAELCQLAGDELGIAPGAIEKDFWVCWTLRELFGMASGRHLTFKGGTSLSKCWGLIKRFSEDIDIVVDREFLGFAGDAAPEAGSSRRERARRVDAIAATCRQYVRDALLPALGAAARSRLGHGRFPVLALDPTAPDQQTILFEYESLFPGTAYLRPVVKLEFGARSDVEPRLSPRVSPYVASIPASGLDDCSFTVKAVAPERTFWEKVSLLHEETNRASGPSSRLARHYYDLWCLGQHNIAARAIDSPELFRRVADHRRLFFPHRAAAQRDLRFGSVRLVPASERMAEWEADFEAMRETMFFEAPPTFAAIISGMRDLEARINALPAAGS